MTVQDLSLYLKNLLCCLASSHRRRLLFSSKYAYSSNICLHKELENSIAASIPEPLKSFSNRDIEEMFLEHERGSHRSGFGRGERCVFSN